MRVPSRRRWSFPIAHADGSLSGYVLRHDLPDGGKETPMVMFVRLADGREPGRVSRFPSHGRSTGWKRSVTTAKW